jgi:hypothetical protein
MTSIWDIVTVVWVVVASALLSCMILIAGVAGGLLVMFRDKGIETHGKIHG